MLMRYISDFKKLTNIGSQIFNNSEKWKWTS